MTRRFKSQHLLQLGDGRAKLRRLTGIAEKDVSAPIRKLLAVHPQVVMAVRINTGAGYLVPYTVMQNIVSAMGGQRAFDARFGKCRWMEFSAPGCPDYLGMLRGGRLLALEVKGSKYVPSRVSDEQRSFLSAVNKGGGLGLVGADVSRVEEVLSGRVPPGDSGYGYFV